MNHIINFREGRTVQWPILWWAVDDDWMAFYFRWAWLRIAIVSNRAGIWLEWIPRKRVVC